MKIRISWNGGSITASLYDTPTAAKLMESLPFGASANTWGDEVYFKTPVNSTLEPDAQQVVEPGTVGFWVEGSSIAIPFGPTPISEGDECRLVTAVNMVGMCDGDAGVLARIADGDAIRVEAV